MKKLVTSAKVTSTSLLKQAYWNIFNLINNRTNVPDQTDPTGARKFVYRRLPNISALNFKGFPFIVVDRTNQSKKKGTVSGTKSFLDYPFEIGVYSQDKDSDAEGDAKGIDQNDEISDSILATLNSSSNKKTLISYGMALMDYDIDTSEDNDMVGKLVFISTIRLNFKNNLTSTG